MRLKSTFLLLLFLIFSGSVFAANQEANVNVILEIEGEYKFEPFKEQSLGMAGFLKNGFVRVVKESEPGLLKYEALNSAMQQARKHVWNVVVDAKIADGLSVKEAVLNAPPYYEYSPSSEEEKKKMELMKEKEREAYIQKKGKEKKYDIYKLYDIIKECGTYKNSGRFYDAVEQKGYACLEVTKKDFFAAVRNKQINIFKDLNSGEQYRPMEKMNVSYDGVIIDTEEDDFVPPLYLKVLSPTEETVYAGLAGDNEIYYARDMAEAKEILASRGAKKVFNAHSAGTTGDTGLRISLPAADRIYAAVKKNKNIPFVIIYKEMSDLPETEAEMNKEKIPLAGD